MQNIINLGKFSKIFPLLSLLFSVIIKYDVKLVSNTQIEINSFSRYFMLLKMILSLPLNKSTYKWESITSKRKKKKKKKKKNKNKNKNKNKKNKNKKKKKTECVSNLNSRVYLLRKKWGVLC